MIRRHKLLASWRCHRTLAPAVVIGLAVALLAIYPAPLLPLARIYRALCEQYPLLALLTFHAPPVFLALLLSFAGLGIFVGIWTGVVALLQTHRFNQCLRRSETTVPRRTMRVANDLGIADRISYLAWAQPAACCYGFVRPRIAVTAGLVTQLDDEELAAVLAHERQHLRRRDPSRYLLLHALNAVAFMFPVVSALRRRQEARIELAADRAALAVAPRGALAGALLAVLNAPRIPVPGVAELTATEARIAQLSGHSVLPEIPARLVITSAALAAIVMLGATHLAVSARLVEMVCEYCTGTA